MTRTVRAGQRVSLVEPSLHDQDEFLALVGSSTSLHEPWVSPPSSREAFATYLEKIRRPENAGFFVKSSQRLVGVVDITNIVMGSFCSGYLSYYVFAGSERQNFMTEALSLAIEHAFEVLGLHRMEANIQPGNERSISLVRRLGFTREGFSARYLKIRGEWRDHERWALTVEQFKRP
jgi:ribosomal-protein-alanine N-acetyltransferase